MNGDIQVVFPFNKDNDGIKWELLPNAMLDGLDESVGDVTKIWDDKGTTELDKYLDALLKQFMSDNPLTP